MAVSSNVRPQSMSSQVSTSYLHGIVCPWLKFGFLCFLHVGPGPLCASGGTDAPLPASSPHCNPSYPKYLGCPLLLQSNPATQTYVEKLRPKEWKC